MGFYNMARLERFERPTAWFVARYSIQLSYSRAEVLNYPDSMSFRQLKSALHFFKTSSIDTQKRLI